MNHPTPCPTCGFSPTLLDEVNKLLRAHLTTLCPTGIYNTYHIAFTGLKCAQDNMKLMGQLLGANHERHEYLYLTIPATTLGDVQSYLPGDFLQSIPTLNLQFLETPDALSLLTQKLTDAYAKFQAVIDQKVA